jgi:hypothetical protein
MRPVGKLPSIWFSGGSSKVKFNGSGGYVLTLGSVLIRFGRGQYSHAQHHSARASKEAALPESSEPINPSSLQIRRTPVASPSKLIGKADCLSFDNVDVLLCEVPFFNLSRLVRGKSP